MTLEDSPIQEWMELYMPEALEDTYDAWNPAMLYVIFKDDMGERVRTVTQRQFIAELKTWMQKHPECGWELTGRNKTLRYSRFMTCTAHLVSAHMNALERAGWLEIDRGSAAKRFQMSWTFYSSRGRGIFRSQPRTLEAARALDDKESIRRLTSDAASIRQRRTALLAPQLMSRVEAGELNHVELADHLQELMRLYASMGQTAVVDTDRDIEHAWCDVKRLLVEWVRETCERYGSPPEALARLSDGDLRDLEKAYRVMAWQSDEPDEAAALTYTHPMSLCQVELSKRVLEPWPALPDWRKVRRVAQSSTRGRDVDPSTIAETPAMPPTTVDHAATTVDGGHESTRELDEQVDEALAIVDRTDESAPSKDQLTAARLLVEMRTRDGYARLKDDPVVDKADRIWRNRDTSAASRTR